MHIEIGEENCELCYKKCKTCKENVKYCLTCPFNSFRELSENHECTCEDRYYDTDEILCEPCDIFCKKCKDNDIFCTECPETR